MWLNQKIFYHKNFKVDFAKMLPLEGKSSEKLKIQGKLLICMFYSVVSGPPFYPSLGLIQVPQCH